MDYCDVFISCLGSFWWHPFTSEDDIWLLTITCRKVLSHLIADGRFQSILFNVIMQMCAHNYCYSFIFIFFGFWKIATPASYVMQIFFFQICSDDETTHLNGCKKAENFWKFSVHFWKLSRILGVSSICGKNLERAFFVSFQRFSAPFQPYSRFLTAWG